MSELVHLYDVVVEDTETDSRPANAQSSDVDKKEGLAGPGGGGVGSHIGMEMAVSSAAKPREGAITCNSMEMIREKHHYANGRLTAISAFVLFHPRVASSPGPFPAFQHCMLTLKNWEWVWG